jgi:hypothetical protein
MDTNNVLLLLRGKPRSERANEKTQNKKNRGILRDWDDTDVCENSKTSTASKT